TDADGAVTNCEQVIHVNVPPSCNLTQSPMAAQVGPGQTTVEVLLDASDSTDSDGSIVQYNWDFGDGTSTTTNTATTNHTYALAGSPYEITLEVIDDGGSTSASCMQTITILPADATLLTCTIAADQTVFVNTSVRYTATVGDIPDGLPQAGLRFFWRVNGGPEMESSDNFVDNTFARADGHLPEETKSISVRITHVDDPGVDGCCAQNFDIINRDPVANAGSNRNVSENTGSNTTTLVGTSSSDPDGDSFTYQWVQVDTPAATLTNSTSSIANVEAPFVSSNTTLTFRLTVTDQHGATDIDFVDVFVSSCARPSWFSTGVCTEVQCCTSCHANDLDGDLGPSLLGKSLAELQAQPFPHGGNAINSPPPTSDLREMECFLNP
ncbi:MAG: PKD domain-containing protein, partial [Planctomycetota bacterium]